MKGSTTALVIIDVQRELFTGAIPIYQADSLLKNINTLASRAHSAGAPVVYVQHSAKNHLIEGSEGWLLHAELQPLRRDIMIRKAHGNSFEETPLAAELAKRDVGTVVICGLVTHGCVRATCLGAIELGYKTIVAGDAHSSRSKDAAQLIEEWNQKLGEAGAQVKATHEIAF